jgi:hypothetical protein
VALYVAVDPLHVLDVVVGVVGLLFALYLDDPASRLVAFGLATAVFAFGHIAHLSAR